MSERKITVTIHSAPNSREIELFEAIAELVHGERFEPDVIADLAMGDGGTNQARLDERERVAGWLEGQGRIRREEGAMIAHSWTGGARGNAIMAIGEETMRNAQAIRDGQHVREGQ